MDQAALRSFGEHVAERAGGPFGDVDMVSGRTLQTFSIAGERAAANLLRKARRALTARDLDRARTFVDRAAQLPYDEHEQVAPAAVGAHMELFCLVADALEQSETDDSRWLDAAVRVLASADEQARYDLRDVLAAIDQDYSLTRPEHSRIQSAIASVPDRAELTDLALSPSELAEHVVAILAACDDYSTALREVR